MESIKVESVLAYEWLRDKHPSHWSRAYFNFNIKYDMLCNNMCEAFNCAIVPVRDKPIITLLEMIRNYLMKRMTKKRTEATKWNRPVGPRVFRYMERVKFETTTCEVYVCIGGLVIFV